MSRIGKRIIYIPDNVEINIDATIVRVKGPKGELSVDVKPIVTPVLNEKELTLTINDEENKDQQALWGLYNALISNAIKGVVEDFVTKLEIKGVGYKASVQGNKIILSLGFSHPIEMEAPAGIAFNVEKNIITVSGIDKQLVNEMAAKIRRWRKPEPYKGKGIAYVGEHIRRKAGKKAVGAGF